MYKITIKDEYKYIVGESSNIVKKDKKGLVVATTNTVLSTIEVCAPNNKVGKIAKLIKELIRIFAWYYKG